MRYRDGVTTYRIDPSATHVHVFTYAEGLFARLAHDLRLTVAPSELTATRDASGKATLRGKIALSALSVDGVMKGDTLKTDVLSDKDRLEILERMRSDVFGGASPESAVTLEGTLEGTSLRLTVSSPSGRTSTATAKVVGTSNESGETVRGELDLHLKEIAGHDVKGPLGAFRIGDRIRITFDAHFVAEP